MKAFRIAGTTDEITECELCGRVELRGTVKMVELDADGNDVAISYFGTSCAAKAAGWTQAAVKKAVKKIADAQAEERWATFRDAYCLENYGTDNFYDAAKLAGVTGMQFNGIIKRAMIAAV